ncbi:hypothetical protein MXB_4035 [Myxobolus squamalis]|nr:hypothetical protein MXB_4035 [Myxobolus squamalis]
MEYFKYKHHRYRRRNKHCSGEI